MYAKFVEVRYMVWQLAMPLDKYTDWNQLPSDSDRRQYAVLIQPDT